MTEETLIVFKEVCWKHADLRYQAFGLYGYGKHVLADSFQVDYQYHIVCLWEARDKLDDYLCLAVLLETTSIIGNVEFILEATTVPWDSYYVVDFNIRGICQVNCLLNWELV
jgi:hypothetical protein